MITQANIISRKVLSQQMELKSRPRMFCSTKYRVKGPVTKVIQKAFALSAFSPKTKDRRHIPCQRIIGCWAKRRLARQSKDRGTRLAAQRQGRFRAVGGHIGTQAQKIAFSMEGQRVWEGWVNVKGGEQRCQRGICP